VRFLICPGMARAGTTFLWQQLNKNSDMFNFSRNQEVRYLSRPKASFLEYLEQFHTADPDKIFLDVSPIYLYRVDNVLKNLKDILADHQVSFVVNIRSPMEQAYSLYLHRIRGHISVLGGASFKGAGQELFEARAINQSIFDSDSYFAARNLKIAPFIKGVIENFGRESLTFIDFNREFGTAGPAAKVENLLRKPLQEFDYSEQVNRGGNALPWYVYGGAKGTTFEWEGRTFIIDPQTLVLISSRMHTQSWTGVDPMQAAQALNGAALWTRFLPRERVEERFNRHFAKQWQRLSELLEYDFLKSVNHKDIVTARSFPPDYLDDVEGVTASQTRRGRGNKKRKRRRKAKRVRI